MTVKEYAKQLKEFQEYLNACFEILVINGDSNSIDSFNNSEFEIKFRGKTAKLANMAVVYQGIEELIQSEIEESEEI